MTRLSTPVWISLLVFGIALAGGLALAATQALAAWRAFRTFRSTVIEALAEMSRRLAEAEKRVAGASARVDELDHARVRLQRALRIAAVLTGASSESWALVERTLGIIPRK